MSISEELPKEMTKDAKVTGIPPGLSLSDAGDGEVVSFEPALGADAGLSDAELPRRSRMTKPSSLSPAIVQSSRVQMWKRTIGPEGSQAGKGALKPSWNEV